MAKLMTPVRTTLLFKDRDGVTRHKAFDTRVSYGTIERFLIMEKHIGLSAHKASIIKAENVL